MQIQSLPTWYQSLKKCYLHWSNTCIFRFMSLQVSSNPNTCTKVMELTRSAAFCQTTMSVREQMNGITAFVDASNVYGSEDETANNLRNMLFWGEIYSGWEIQYAWSASHVQGWGYKGVPSFGALCSCCCFPLLPQPAWKVLTTWWPFFQPSPVFTNICGH